MRKRPQATSLAAKRPAFSHDRNLLESVVDRLWLVDKGTVTTYDGTLKDYRALQLEKQKQDKKTPTQPEKKKNFARKSAAEARKRIAPLKKKYDRIEERIEASHIAIIDIVHLIDKLEDDGLLALEAYETARAEEGLD